MRQLPCPRERNPRGARRGLGIWAVSGAGAGRPTSANGTEPSWIRDERLRMRPPGRGHHAQQSSLRGVRVCRPLWHGPCSRGRHEATRDIAPHAAGEDRGSAREADHDRTNPSTRSEVHPASGTAPVVAHRRPVSAVAGRARAQDRPEAAERRAAEKRPRRARRRYVLLRARQATDARRCALRVSAADRPEQAALVRGVPERRVDEPTYGRVGEIASNTPCGVVRAVVTVSPPSWRNSRRGLAPLRSVILWLGSSPGRITLFTTLDRRWRTLAGRPR